MAKSRDAFRTISEVAEWLETPAHVLRFWESKFTQIKPVKRAGGRRYYRPADMELLGGIKQLLHEDGMTIKGVQKVLREHGVRHVSSLNATSVDEDGVVPSTDIIEDAPYVEVEVPDSVVAFPGTEAASEPSTPAQTADMFETPEPQEAAEGDVAEVEDAPPMSADALAGIDGTAVQTPNAPEAEPSVPQSEPEEHLEVQAENADTLDEFDPAPETEVDSQSSLPDEEAIQDGVEDETPPAPQQEDEQAESPEESEPEQDAPIDSGVEVNKYLPTGDQPPTDPVVSEQTVLDEGDDENGKEDIDHTEMASPPQTVAQDADEPEVPAEDDTTTKLANPDPVAAVEPDEADTGEVDRLADVTPETLIGAPDSSIPNVEIHARPALLSLLSQIDSLSQQKAQALLPHYAALRDIKTRQQSN